MWESWIATTTTTRTTKGIFNFQLLNFGLFDKEIKKGDRIGQGIFLPFLKADTDEENDMNERTGGFGSSGVR